MALNFTTIHSSPEVKLAGLPFTVARIHPRESIAAFRTEDDAVAYSDWLNNPESDVTEEAVTLSKEEYLAWRKHQAWTEQEQKRQAEEQARKQECCEEEEEKNCEIKIEPVDREEALARARETAARIKAELQARKS